MATLSQITLAHSRRISAITRVRDEAISRVNGDRDAQARAVPAAARLYAAFDEQVAEARNKQLATDQRAEGARASALQAAADSRAGAVDTAHRRRTDADLAAFTQRRKAEEAAEKKFLDALAANPSRGVGDAQKTRAADTERARQEFTDALKASQDRFRTDVDAALIEERKDARAVERAFEDAMKIGESSSRLARSTAEQTLVKGLSLITDAATVLERWREATAQVLAEFRRAQQEEMARFHDEMQTLRA